MPTERDTVYLRRMLQQNPLDASAEILAARTMYLNPVQAASPLFEEETPHERADRRLRLLKQVDRVRRMFWEWDDATLRDRLNAIHAGDFPEVVVSLEHLKAVADQREGIRRLEMHPKCVPELLSRLKRLLIASEKDAAELRSTDRSAMMLPGIWYPKAQRNLQNAAKLIRDHYPDVFALEPEWLERMLERSTWQFAILDSDQVDGAMGLLFVIITIIIFYLVWS